MISSRVIFLSWFLRSMPEFIIIDYWAINRKRERARAARIGQGWYSVFVSSEECGCYIVNDLMINFKLILFINHNNPNQKTNNHHLQHIPTTQIPSPQLHYHPFSVPAKITQMSPSMMQAAMKFPSHKQVNLPSSTLPSASFSSQHSDACLSARSYFPSKIWPLKSRSSPSYFIPSM